MDLKALLICSSGWSAEGLAIGQGHVFRCQSFAAHLEKLGWQTRVLELSSASEHLRQTLKDAWDLLLIDSYHLPQAFYRHCAELVPKSCCLLVQDDLDRFATDYYPKGYYAIQAGFAGPSTERCLRGLEYQVLRPEFTDDSIEPLGNYALLVPGSAFSLAQLEVMAAALCQNWNLSLLLSERHSTELGDRTFPVEGVSCFQRLNAAELRTLYARAQLIFCAASQSLLEVLSCSRQKIVVLLTADNQVPMLEQLGVARKSQIIDLRGSAKLSKIFAELSQTTDFARPLAVPNDGKAVLRILQKVCNKDLAKKMNMSSPAAEFSG